MNKKLLSVIGIGLLLTGSLGPVATLNNKAISIIPIWNNFVIYDGLWKWMDISFFAITFIIILFLSVYFTIKKIPYGLLISGFIILFIITIIFFAILRLKFKYSLYGDIDFTLQWGWLFLFAGTILVLLGSLNRSK